MLREDFKKRLGQFVPVAKGEGHKPNNKELYLKLIEELITELGQATEKDAKETILDQLKEADVEYLKAQGSTIARQVLFTRHAKCSNGQKNYGLAPNATVEDDALNNMANTNQSTSHLILNNNSAPTIVISPMTRALQTAAKVIPVGLTTDISINPALSENTNAPSGSDVRSYDQLVAMRKATPFFTSPVQKILFWLASLIYSPSDFASLKIKRNEAIDTLDIKNAQGDDEYRDVNITEEEKIRETNSLINTGDNDLWLIGHGKNFKAFFNTTFGNNSAFDYGETRSVYTLDPSKENVPNGLFSPPYILKVNQVTGEIDGVYTGITKGVKLEPVQPKVEQDSPTELTTDSSNTLAQLGGRVEQPLASKSIQNTDTLATKDKEEPEVVDPTTTNTKGMQ